MDTILLTGKTSLFPKEALQYIADSAQVFVTGRKSDEGTKDLPDHVRMFPAGLSDSDFRKVFEIAEIRAVWHVARCTDSVHGADESGRVDQIARLCSQNGVPRMIVLTEDEDPADYRKIIGKWASPADKSPSVEIAVIRLPLLTGSASRGRLDTIFGALRRDETICLEGNSDQMFSVITMQEMTALLLRMTMDTVFEPGIYTADGNAGTLEDFRTVLLSIRPDARIEYSQESTVSRRGVLSISLPQTREDADCDGRLEKLYRLPVSVDWGTEITEQYGALVEETGETSSLKARFSAFMQTSGKLAGTVLDLVIMFIIAEYLARITSASVYFKIADVRLIFVILMGMMHGIAAGFAAAILECIMLVLRYHELGISGLLLFYNVENWIPFVYYLTAGAISGYSHQKREQQTRSVMAENELIRNKYLFLNEAYRTSVANRKDLWTQILNEEESYAKIYGAVRQMSQRTPEAVCVEAVDVLRRLLNNETVSIYQLDAVGKKAALLSCCRQEGARMSMSTGECPELFRTVRDGETWKNIHFSESAPMYAAMVGYNRTLQHNSDQTRPITFLVTIEKAEQDQLSLWYMNHFTILCGLFQDALEHAALRERTLS